MEFWRCSKENHFRKYYIWHTPGFSRRSDLLSFCIWPSHSNLSIWTTGLPWGGIQSISPEWEACDWGASAQPDAVLPPPALRTQPRPAARAAAQSGQMVPAKPSFLHLYEFKQQCMHLHYMANSQWTQLSPHCCILFVWDPFSWLVAILLTWPAPCAQRSITKSFSEFGELPQPHWDELDHSTSVPKITNALVTECVEIPAASFRLLKQYINACIFFKIRCSTITYGCNVLVSTYLWPSNTLKPQTWKHLAFQRHYM